MRKKSSEKSRVKVTIVMFLVLLLAMGMLFQVWLKVKIQLLATDIENLKRETLTLREDNNRLQTKVSDLSSYRRITGFAQNELGMIFLKQEVVRASSN